MIFLFLFGALAADKLKYKSQTTTCTNCASVVQESDGKFHVKKGMVEKMYIQKKHFYQTLIKLKITDLFCILKYVKNHFDLPVQIALVIVVSLAAK